MDALKSLPVPAVMGWASNPVRTRFPDEKLKLLLLLAPLSCLPRK